MRSLYNHACTVITVILLHSNICRLKGNDLYLFISIKFDMKLIIQHSCVCHIYVGTPGIRYPPKDQKVDSSAETSFTCTAVGYPHPNIDWIKNNNTFLKNQSSLGTLKYKIFIYPPFPLGDCSISECGVRSTLVIQNVSADDVGIYTCNATNSIGTAIASAKLTIGNLANSTVLHIA